MGSGVIPFALRDGAVFFLFQKTFSGRKTGFLIDFGGGVAAGESDRQAAVREFIEETETMYFSTDLQSARRTEKRVREQIPLVASLFDKTLSDHPEWCCRRINPNPLRPKNWKTFFVEFPYRDVGQLNDEWQADQAGRFKKPRELVWLEAQELLGIYAEAPDRLWKRVRQLENAAETIRSIVRNRVD